MTLAVQRSIHEIGAKASHRALERHHAGVREWWDSRGFGHELRKRFLLGATEDGSEATLPFWSHDQVLFLIRCKLQRELRYILPSTEELPDSYKPLFIPGSFGCEIFVVEGFIDALAVAATGRTAVAVGGTCISDEQSKELRRLLPKQGCLYCLPDDDAAGAEAARTLGRQFFPQAKICAASYRGGREGHRRHVRLPGIEEDRRALDEAHGVVEGHDRHRGGGGRPDRGWPTREARLRH